MVQIDDGGGKNGRATVSSTQRLDVSSRSNPRAFYISRDIGQAYTWTSKSDLDDNEFILSIQNTSVVLTFFIESVRIGGSKDCKWLIKRLDSGTPSGGTINAVNINLGSGNDAPATAFGNAAITGSLTTTTIARVQTLAHDSDIIDFRDSLILGQNDTIIVQYSGSAGDADCTIRGFFDSE